MIHSKNGKQFNVASRYDGRRGVKRGFENIKLIKKKKLKKCVQF